MATRFARDESRLHTPVGGRRAARRHAPPRAPSREVAIIEKTTVVAGVSVNLGTIPSKTLREAVLDLAFRCNISRPHLAELVPEPATLATAFI